MHGAPPAAAGKGGMVCETYAGPGVLLLSRPVAIYALVWSSTFPKRLFMDVPHTARVGTAKGQAWGLGPLGAWAGWFVAAGMGSPSEAAGRLVLSLAPLVTVAPLPMSHVMTQHRSKKWEIWSNTLLCISLLPGEWLHPEPFGLCWPLSSQLLCQR